MLRNISVRTFILSYLLVVFIVIDGLVIFLAPQTSLLILLNSLFLVAWVFLWIYMTQNQHREKEHRRGYLGQPGGEHP